MAHKSSFDAKKTFAQIALCILIASNTYAANTPNQTLADVIEKATTTEKTTPRVSAVEKKMDKFLRQQKRLMLVWLTASALYVTVDQYGKDNKLVVTAVDDALVATKRTWNNAYDTICSWVNNVTAETSSTTQPTLPTTTSVKIEPSPSVPGDLLVQPASQEQAQKELKEAVTTNASETAPTLDTSNTSSDATALENEQSSEVTK